MLEDHATRASAGVTSPRLSTNTTASAACILTKKSHTMTLLELCLPPPADSTAFLLLATATDDDDDEDAAAALDDADDEEATDSTQGGLLRPMVRAAAHVAESCTESCFNLRRRCGLAAAAPGAMRCWWGRAGGSQAGEEGN